MIAIKGSFSNFRTSVFIKFRLMKKSILLTLLLLGKAASGVVLSPASVQLQEGSFFGGEAGFLLGIDIFDPNDPNFGSFSIEINQFAPSSSGTFEFGDFSIGAVPDIFVSDSGSFFGNSNISTLTPLFDSSSLEQESFSIPVGESVFFNYVFDFFFAEPDYEFSSIPGNFGWFEIRNEVGPNGPNLVLVDSAVSTRFGIITGTTQVPEPSTTALSLLGIGLLLNRRRR